MLQSIKGNDGPGATISFFVDLLLNIKYNNKKAERSSEMSVGKIIAKLCREAGYTQKTLADALHITDKAVSKWERGICGELSIINRRSTIF